MGDVVRMVNFRGDEAEALLRALLMSAAAGDILDIAARVRTRHGEKIVMTDYYLRRGAMPPPDSQMEL